MSQITYMIVEHDGGWAYRLDGVYSETFPTREEAETAADVVASEQQVPGETEVIRYQDAEGRWHEDVATGQDRPETHVEEDGRRLR